MRLVRWAQTAVAGLPVPVGILYLLSTIFNLLAFNQGDLNHTVGSSYAYLFGHGLDFYDYNATEFTGNDYFPTTYIVFALWMAPVKFLVSPGVQNGVDLSAPEVAWAKLLLLLLFWATFLVVSKIAQELFPGRENTQATVRIAFLLSPLAAFASNVFGQYDILGVFFVALGFLFYLRGDKWRFAIFFALAASSKYFALLILLPLVLLQFKKLKDIVLLGLVGVSVLAIQALIYLSNEAFREHTLFSLVGGKASTAGGQVLLAAVIFLVGCVVLWRIVPTRQNLGQLAVLTVIVVYGLMFAVVVWHPQWFIILTPFFAFALGYLRRPAWFLVWDSLFFVAYIWIAGHRWIANVDLTMVDKGALRDVLGDPAFLLSDLYPAVVLPALSAVVVFYVFSPLAVLVIERAGNAGRTAAVVAPAEAPVGAPLAADGVAVDGHRTPIAVWLLRVLILPLAWTLPAIIAISIPAPAL